MVKATTKKAVKKTAAKKSVAKKASVKRAPPRKQCVRPRPRRSRLRKWPPRNHTPRKQWQKRAPGRLRLRKLAPRRWSRRWCANQPLANHHRRRQALRRLCDGGDKGNETAGRGSQARCLRKGISRAAGCPTSHCCKQFSLGKMAAGSPVSRGARTLRSVAVTGQHGCCGLCAGSSSQGK